MRFARSVRVVAAALSLVLLTSACAEADLELSAVSTGDDDRRGLPDPDDMEVEVPEDLEVQALTDVEDFWDDTFPDVYGSKFEPISGGFIPYTSDEDVPDCGPQQITYEEAVNNAFYCSLDDYIAWDDVSLLPHVEETYGPLAVGVIMAHEYGHAIQNRIDTDGARTIITELQADCFAGAWAQDVNGRIPYFASDHGALVASVAAFVELLRDEPGGSENGPNAHGSAFDRVSAFQDGYEDGAAKCATYIDDEPVITQMEFRDGDFATGGNLPTADLLESLPTDLDSFYTALLDGEGVDWDPLDEVVIVDPDRDEVRCDRETFSDDELEYFSLYCDDDDTIYIDGDELLPELESIGDMAVGGELSRLYAVKAQQALDLSGSDHELMRHADCLTGVFISAMFLEQIPDAQLLISAGDVDEIVILFLVFAEGPRDASPLERIDDFRNGFLDGYSECEDLV